MPELPAAATELVESITHPGHLADLIAANVDVPIEEKQAVLETVDLKARMKLVLELLNRKREILKLSQQDRLRREGRDVEDPARVLPAPAAQGDQGGARRDGRGGGGARRARRSGSRRPACRPRWRRSPRRSSTASRPSPPPPASTRSRAPTSTGSPTCPGRRPAEDNLDIENARAILDADHYGIQKVKKRILEYLAVRKLKNDMQGPHPLPGRARPASARRRSASPSPGRSGRKFVRLSLGGVRDEAEIRGHRRTYVGALPGRFIQSMKKAGTKNPVMMLDEIDKLGADFRGDPSAALLEVLDPEQNNTFSDHYLDVAFDLSKVMFIATANQLDPIPGPLRDRMEIIELSGYTFEEKQQIARIHLVPKQLREHGLSTDHIAIEDEALLTLITSYTREAGVRNLERRIADICRAVAVEVAAGQDRQADHHLGPGEGDPRARGLLLGGRRAHRGAGRRHRPGLDGGGRRHPLHRGHQDGRQGRHDAHRPARRRDEGVGAGGAQLPAQQGGRPGHQRRTSSRRRTSTSTSRRAPSPRTARRPASPSSPRSPRS